MFRKIFACLAVIAGSVLLAPLSAGANTFNTVRTFCTGGGGCSAGEIYPGAALAEFNGRLYGPAAEGAEFGRGAIFSIDPTTNAYALEVEMNGTTDTGEYGSYPAGPVTLKNGRF